MTRLLASVGIDAAQWRALTRAYLVMDMRRAGGPKKQDSGRQRASAVPHVGLLVGAVMNSVSIALLVFVLRDPFTASVAMVAMSGVTIAMLLLVDFTGSVMSSDDYWVVAPRPVSSRTYFAARLAAVLAYVISFAAVMSFIPALVFLAWHRLGIGAFVGAISATVLTGVAGAAVIIGVYTYLLAHLPPSRLVRLMSVVHLLASTVSMAGFLFVIKALDSARISDYSISSVEWIWYVPVSWFAAIVPALAGLGGWREASAAAAAVAMTPLLLSLACGRLSLEFASKLSEASSQSSLSAARRRVDRVPGFARGEAYAVATLVRAQFRYDMRFRLGVLGILPMTAFYLAIGWNDGLWQDPFVGWAKGTGPIYMAVGFLPMILHGALQASDHWKASWIFFATPADPGRLVVASKNFVAVFVLGTYLLLLAAFWATFYERVWHAVVHAFFIGAGAHMLLQGAVILSPALPFAKEPKRAEQSGKLFVLFTVGMVFTSTGPLLLPFVYARPWLMVAVAVVLIGATIVLERALHRRARAYTAQLELA